MPFGTVLNLNFTDTFCNCGTLNRAVNLISFLKLEGATHTNHGHDLYTTGEWAGHNTRNLALKPGFSLV